MKKILVAAALALASLAAFAQDVEPVQYIPKHEFTVNVFGGLNLGSVMLPGQETRTVSYVDPNNGVFGNPTSHQFPGEEVNGAFHTKPGLTFGAGLGYIWHFSDHWAFQTGVDFALYKYHVYTTQDGPTDGVLFSGMNYVRFNPNGNVTENWTGGFAHTGFREDATLGSIQIPLMIQWSTPISEKHRFYVAGGATVGINVYGKSKQHWDELTHTSISLTWNEGEAGRFEVDDLRYARDQYSYSAVSGATDTLVVFHKAPLDVRASLEVGFRWSLAPGWGLYTGIYADYGLLNQFLKKNYSLVEGRSDWDEYVAQLSPRNQAEDPYGDKDQWSYHSIFNSVGLPVLFTAGGQPIYNAPAASGPHYATALPREQYSAPGNRYFDGGIHAGAVGFKIRLSFGKVKKHPKPAPIVQTVSEPVVSRPAAPAPAPVAEVPEEIKRTMQELSVTLFAFDKFNLDAKAIAGLKKVIDWLQEFPDLQVQIEGHTDWEGSDEYNQKLSERRAKSVHDYFVEHGVNPERLSYIGYGESRPIATNETAEGRQKNRRVELTILQ